MNNYNELPIAREVTPEEQKAAGIAYDLISTRQRALNWLLTGEVGISSKTMLSVYLDIGPQSWYNNPADYDDFNRCMMMLEQIPEVKEVLPQIAKLSYSWEELVGQWDKLEALYKEVKEGQRTIRAFNEIFYPIRKKGLDKDIKASWEARHVIP